MNSYESNRVKFQLADLRQYAGQWVALTASGDRIVASAPTLAALEEQLVAQGEDAQSLAFEHLDFEDSFAGGSDIV